MRELDTTGAPARSTGNAPVRRKSAAPSWGEIDFRFVDVQRSVALARDTPDRKRALLDAADRFYPLIRWGEIKLQDAVDGLCDVARNHGLLTEYIELEIGERLRGYVDPAWQQAASEYHQNRGPDQPNAPPIIPCGSAESDAAWDEFDRRERERQAREDARPPKARPTPEVTVEAIMVAVRERGLAALQEPAVRERVCRCDTAARDRINRLIGKMVAAGTIK